MSEIIEVIDGKVRKTKTVEVVNEMDASERLKNIDDEIAALDAEKAKLVAEKAILTTAGIVKAK